MADQGVDEILRVAGIPFSWTSTSSKISGVPYTGILSFDVSESREGELIHAQRPSGLPIGITSGLYKVDSMSFKTLLDTGEQICQQLGAAPGANGSFGNVRWDYTLEVFEPGCPTLTIHVTGVKIEKRKLVGVAKGTEVLGYEFECKALLMTTIGAKLGLSGLTSVLANINGGV